MHTQTHIRRQTRVHKFICTRTSIHRYTYTHTHIMINIKKTELLFQLNSTTSREEHIKVDGTTWKYVLYLFKYAYFYGSRGNITYNKSKENSLNGVPLIQNLYNLYIYIYKDSFLKYVS